MFTGIIEHVGTISSCTEIPSGCSLRIKTQFTDLILGESIAVNGICLTVTQIEYDVFVCDVSPETLLLTTASQFTAGTPVNLERALLPLTRIGGHFVSGHVDQTCWVKSIKQAGQFIEMTFAGLKERFLFKKGSIAVNGVSLTVNQVMNNEFSVMLVPHTLERTTLSMLHENDEVNIEFDMMARAIVEQVKQYKEGVCHV